MSELKYSKGEMWLHCSHCMNNPRPEFKGKAPKDYNTLEASSYPFEYPDGHVENILVLWCHVCQRQVWDSQHLIPREK